MKNITWTTSASLILLGTILLLGSLVNIFFEQHYLIAAFMMIAAFGNFADAMRRRNHEKNKMESTK